MAFLGPTWAFERLGINLTLFSLYGVVRMGLVGLQIRESMRLGRVSEDVHVPTQQV